MKLTVLGCSGSMSGPAGAASAYLLQAGGYSITLDFGPGAMGQLLRYLDPADLDAMFFSHLHADHCVDITGMHVYRRWFPDGPLPAVDVYSPADGMARTRQIGDDPEDETYSGAFHFKDFGPGARTTVGPMTIEAFPAVHPVPAVGLRIIGPSELDPKQDVIFGFTGDTDLCDGEIEMARHADLLLAEAAFEDGRDEARGIHMTGTRAGQLAQQAGARKLLLTHLQPWTSPENVRRAAESVFAGPVRPVEPGETYTV
ncbi:MBL fold metallo-hydrolase [Ancrocorticia populi]|uniref:MBL fold metallo-hydrolase n=2 Tax=Ancrocorticia populi TaxID=2175228 RepID=A0A2V1K864_9ACTO|nr:MBL fold metallo-hydrolase [Ancrocorticia populi]PWF27658.1 MBL fold metallo-hydrolase [Ancrocorticia populi]